MSARTGFVCKLELSYMLQAYPDLGDCEISADRLKREGLNGHTWIDLQDPTAAEIAEVEAACSLRVPSRAELEEIELPSRIRTENDTLYRSVPLIVRTEDGSAVTAPTGFVLNSKVCLTVRFAVLA